METFCIATLSNDYTEIEGLAKCMLQVHLDAVGGPCHLARILIS